MGRNTAQAPGQSKHKKRFPPFASFQIDGPAEVSVKFGRPVHIERCAFFCLEKTNICAILKGAFPAALALDFSAGTAASRAAAE